jgi:fatty-acyl-CoA synthase
MDLAEGNYNQTMGEALEAIAQQFPDQEALVFGGVRDTFRQWDDKVNTLVPQFEELGVSKGDRVGIMLPTSTDIAYVLFALNKIGAVSVLVNPMLQAGELEFLLQDAGASGLVVVSEIMDRDLVAMVEEIRPNLPELRHVIVKGPKREGYLSLDEMLAAGAPAPGQSFVREGVGPHDLMALLYTGGTTGLPKGVMATSYDFLYVDATNREQDITEKDTYMLLPQLYLTAGLRTLAPTVLFGMRLVGLSSFAPKAILQTIQDEKVTMMFGYPTMMRWVMGLPMFEQYDVSSMRIITVGGEPVTTELIEEIQERFSCRTLTGYGSTEVRGCTATKLYDPPELVANSDGRPLPGAEIKLVDKDRQEVPFGEVGEIAVRGPMVFQGYWNRPEVNAEVFDEDGYFYTADLVRMINEQQYIRFVGREKETIRRGGMTIYPEEVENHLRAHPKIANAGVIAVPSPVAGERVRAYVQLQPGTEMTPTDVVEHCRGGLATYKLPAEVRIVPALPLSPTNRVQRWKLREEARQELEAGA